MQAHSYTMANAREHQLLYPGQKRVPKQLQTHIYYLATELQQLSEHGHPVADFGAWEAFVIRSKANARKPGQRNAQSGADMKSAAALRPACAHTVQISCRLSADGHSLAHSSSQ